jgi:branched-chain amino acid transport system ATP-binding protein
LRKQWGKKGATLEGPPPTVEELLARVGLTDVADVRADSLPTGQGRLVELARALAIRPRLLLLDEPASGQDEEETKAFAALLRSLAAEGMAILLVEHDMELVMQVCSNIFVLDFGQLMAEGDPDTVRADPKVQAAYLGTTKEVAA